MRALVRHVVSLVRPVVRYVVSSVVSLATGVCLSPSRRIIKDMLRGMMIIQSDLNSQFGKFCLRHDDWLMTHAEPAVRGMFFSDSRF